MSDPMLRAILADLEANSRPAVIRFRDGQVDQLRIVSTMHVEEGGDVVAAVVRAVVANADAISDGSFMNFDIADVASVTLDDVRLFGPSADF